MFTCSALRRAYRDVHCEGHPSVPFVHLIVDPNVLERRMTQRAGHYMPASLLESQFATLEALQPDEPGFVVSGELPPDQIVDKVKARLAVAVSPRPGEAHR